MSVRAVVAAASARVRADLRVDPWLRVVLVLTVVLCGFWLWHGAPNFATWDERDRLLDVLVAYGAVLADPGLDSLAAGVAWGRRPFGGTFYLYAVALLPVVLAAALAGDLGALAAIPFPTSEFGFYPVWESTPAWLWTASIVSARLVSVLAAVGSVYLTYRLGTALRDRSTGRLAAAFLALTFEVVVLAHEAGEDLPALFGLLLSLYLLVRYVQDGGRARFYAAAVAGGVTVGLKLTAAPIVPTVLVAYALRHRGEAGWWRARPLWVGAGLGAVAVFLSFPDLLVGNVGPVVARLTGQSTARVGTALGPEAPVWWWFLRGYFGTFGLPLAIAVGCGTLAAAVHLVRHSWDDGLALALCCLGLFLALFVPWHDFRPHHLLPTVPLLVLALAVTLRRLRERRPAVGALVVVGLLVTTGAYAGVGAAGYASLPRDEAVDWMGTNVPANATMESYQWGFDNAAVPHGLRMVHPYGRGPRNAGYSACPDYIQVTHEDLLYLRSVPDDQRVRYVRYNVEARATYLRALLNGSYNYRVVATFGDPAPDFVPDRPEPGSLVDILSVGIRPQSDRYGDEQELAANQAVVVLEQTGACDGARTPPW